MGRIRPNFIKRIAREAVKKYRDKLSTDYYENREFLETVIRFSNDRLKNRVTGYVTTLMKQHSSSEFII
ncbi:MAG: 30S ribosomal protein S17e [Theionarchaea archaeon]|nr:30S ribosomal protein S17e [Theionarchaea archaeon]